MQIKDVPPGSKCFTSARFTDPEIREIHYLRLEGQASRERHVRVARLRTIQGEPGKTPRYDSGEYYCVDPGETPESIVVALTESVFLDANMNLKPIKTEVPDDPTYVEALEAMVEPETLKELQRKYSKL